MSTLINTKTIDDNLEFSDEDIDALLADLEATEPKISVQYKRLTEQLPDLEEHIQQDKINVVPLTRWDKYPLITNWNKKVYPLTEELKYKTKNGKEYTQVGLKYHRGNYGVIIGYGNKRNGYSIACIDIDGYKTSEDNPDLNIKKETQKLIYEDLKDLPNCIIVQTQSEGYHIYYWNKKTQPDTSTTSHSLYFPKDFKIKELAGKCLNDSIEVFTNQDKKQTVLAGSKTRTGEYQVISELNKLAGMDIVEDLNQLIIDTLISKGYTYKPTIADEPTPVTYNKNNGTGKSKSNSNLKSLSQEEIKKVIELVTPIFPIIDGAKHNGALYLGGYFSYHISKDSSSQIAEGIVKKIGDIFDNSQDFIKTVLKNYDRQENKAGLPKLCELIQQRDNNFNINVFSDELNNICNKQFRKEKITTITINENEVPVYLMDENHNKWLKYEGLLEGIDLTIDFNKKIGSFRYSKTGKEVDSFKFKFKNNFFEIVKIKELEEYLESEGIKLPKFFERDIRASLNNLDKRIFKTTHVKEFEEATNEIEENKDTVNDIIFGDMVSEDDSYYLQSKKGIEKITESENKEGHMETETVSVANVIIKKVEIILDSLGILEPVYNVTYNNLTFKKEITAEYLTNNELVTEFKKAKVFYNARKDFIDEILNYFIIDGTKNERITTKTEAYLKGFYIVNGKVVENSKLQNLKEYTTKDVAEAIKLLNEIMFKRSDEGKANDSTVYRFMLWSPFSYCLKQIGYKTGIYSLILIGKTKGNKSGAISLGRLFYLITDEENSGATVSVLGSKLEEDSFCKSFDECYNLLNQPETPDVMKKATQDKTTRITKNRADNKKSDVFNAFALPVFLLNERMEFKDYIRERYKIRDYTSKSYVTKEDRKKFDETYIPADTEGTILRKLALIGNEYKKKIIPLIESKDKRLFNPEKLTIDLLHEIADDTSKAIGEKVEFLPEMYEITEDSSNYDYDISKEVIKLLNTEFKKKNKVINNEYTPRHFIESVKNNDFDFITYNRYCKEGSDKHFLINFARLTKFVNNNVEETVEIESILDYLGLTDILKEKMGKEDYNESYEKYITKQNKIKVEGSKNPKNIRGFYLSINELINNLFSFNLDFTKDKKADEKTKTNKGELVENK